MQSFIGSFSDELTKTAVNWSKVLKSDAALRSLLVGGGMAGVHKFLNPDRRISDSLRVGAEWGIGDALAHQLHRMGALRKVRKLVRR